MQKTEALQEVKRELPQVDIKVAQAQERRKCLETILDSKAEKKLIVAGPGTGKTFTFGEVLKNQEIGEKLVMTFIKKLVTDMTSSLGQYAEVKTFHAFCKNMLHGKRGRVEIVKFLTKLIERDACLLEKNGLKDFDAKIRSIDEESPELSFYLSRGDYYDVMGFDDSVYRLYKLLKKKPTILPQYVQIVIDEFQDFNPLEVAFISEIEKRGNILIVGDDDQAIYDDLCASPSFLREKYNSGEYVVFELPFCSRCPQVIVDATNSIIEKAQSLGHYKDRIRKRYECYLDDKEKDSQLYPKIIYGRCAVGRTISNYVKQEVSKISSADIVESNVEGKEYPTVLIVGSKQYLFEVENSLRAEYPQISYPHSEGEEFKITDGYEFLLEDKDSNLGWRILVEFFFDVKHLRKVLLKAEREIALVKLLDEAFVREQLMVVEMIRKISKDIKLTASESKQLKSILGDYYDQVIGHFAIKEKEKKLEIDRTKPTILLTSFKGCKGLSAGHVFIIGMNNSYLPKDSSNIRDIEISQFIVALTRTRKRCHVLSNKWLFPKDKLGNWQPECNPSELISWIPEELIENRGEINAESLQRLK